MTDQVQEAISTANEWNDAFNVGDVETCISHMHFPHLRLSGKNEFESFKDPDAYRDRHKNSFKMLREKEGWHHTTSLSVDAVQMGAEKVHLTIRQSRRHEDGTEYKVFDTFWIITKIDGRWGLQFRSSFLDARG
ncbi:hypothetical protein M1N23_04050 [Dehalococcoidia bacterium]|nr:hypothetical protein [Dehalococcoidia bacterium]